MIPEERKATERTCGYCDHAEKSHKKEPGFYDVRSVIGACAVVGCPVRTIQVAAMTPEERKAIAMRQYLQPGALGERPISQTAECVRGYPNCCAHHEGFDAALRLLVPPKHHEQGGACWSIEATP